MSNQITKAGSEKDRFAVEDNTGENFYIMPNWIVRSQISDGAFAVYSFIRSYCANMKRSPYFSISSYAKLKKKCRKQVSKHLNELTEMNLIRCSNQKNQFGCYVITLLSTAEPVKIKMQELPEGSKTVLEEQNRDGATGHIGCGDSPHGENHDGATGPRGWGDRPQGVGRQAPGGGATGPTINKTKSKSNENVRERSGNKGDLPVTPPGTHPGFGEGEEEDWGNESSDNAPDNGTPFQTPEPRRDFPVRRALPGGLAFLPLPGKGERPEVDIETERLEEESRVAALEGLSKMRALP